MKTTKTYDDSLFDGPLRVFEDASGAPAVLRHNGYAFAFDCLGEIKCNNIAPKYGSRHASKVAQQICERAYRKALEATTTPAWHEANKAMYA